MSAAREAGGRAEELLAREGTRLSVCRCGATVEPSLNYEDASLVCRLRLWHQEDCVQSWTPLPATGEPVSLVELMRVVIPPESGNEFRLRMVELVDSDECDSRCLFADALTERTCDCKCEGANHGSMREWLP